VQRQRGVDYATVARSGGGILSTVAATRAASHDELVAAALPRALALRAEGVATLEIKSGYGLDLDTERRILQAARCVGERTGQRVVTTFLGAHAVPPEFAGRADDYIDFLCADVLPVLAAEGLIDAVDAFHEDIAFDAAQVERLFGRARDLGLPVKLHADQLGDRGGAALAARHGALSADHLEHADDAGVTALAQAGTVAVLLPAAYYGLGGGRRPPVDALRRHGVPMALATDCNPGSSPTTSLLTVLNMGCRLFGLTPDEAFAGVTRVAAQALGLGAECGTLEVGKRADLVAWDVDDMAELGYWLGRNPARRIAIGGAIA
jgi:imidazolonepropionase